MPERLCIFLDSQGLTANAIILDEKQHMIAYYHDCDLAEVSQLQHNLEVIIFLCGLQTKIAYVNLPNFNLEKINQVLPYTLEEELAEDIENLHFAVNIRAKIDQLYQVAIIKNSVLKQLLEKLRQYQIKAEYIIPDIATFNPPPGESWLIINRLLKYRTRNIALNFTDDLLPLVSQQYPNVSKIISFRDTNQEMISTVQANYPQSPHIPSTKSYYQIVAEQCDLNHCPNLLPNDSKLTNKPKKNLSIWHGVAFISLLSLFVYFSDTLARFFIMKKQLTSLQSSSAVFYKKIFPDTKSMIDPEIKIKRLLQNNLYIQSKTSLFLILQKLAASANNNTMIKFSHLDYANAKLQIDLQIPQFKDLENFERKLTANKLQVKRIKAYGYQNNVTATLEVTL